MSQDNLNKVNGDENLYARVAKWLAAQDYLDELDFVSRIEQEAIQLEQAAQIMEEVYHSANKPQDLREVQA
jgi:ligand-binding sensor protein